MENSSLKAGGGVYWQGLNQKFELVPGLQEEGQNYTTLTFQGNKAKYGPNYASAEAKLFTNVSKISVILMKIFHILISIRMLMCRCVEQLLSMYLFIYSHNTIFSLEFICVFFSIESYEFHAT